MMLLFSLGGVFPAVQIDPTIRSGRNSASSGFQGKLSKIPPSYSSIESIAIGLKTRGMDIDERTASLKFPLRMTTGRRWFMSLATQRNGTIRRLKSPSEAAVAGAKSSVSARSTCVEEIRFVGNWTRSPAGFPRFTRTLRNEGVPPNWR